jgi:Cu+-exporting ATPase
MKQKYLVQGMTCAACQLSVQKSVASLKGVKEVQVNLLTHAMSVEYDQAFVTPQKIIHEVKEAGYGAKVSSENELKQSEKYKQLETSFMRLRMIISIVFLIPLMYLSMGIMLDLPLPSILQEGIYNITLQMLLTLPIVIYNFRYFSVGLKRLIKLDPNMDSLVAIGTGSAIM